MNYECLACNVILSKTNVCPLCNRVSTTRSASTISIEEITEDESPPTALKRKREMSPSPSSSGADKMRGLEVGRVPLITPSSASRSSYALAHTLGRCRFDPFGGDGAYSNWMQQYFSEHLDPRGCVHVDRLDYTGGVGNIKDSELSEKFDPDILRELQRFLNNDRLNRTRTVVLNWHIRCTGTPNGWTGRGASAELMKKLKRMAKRAKKELAVIYTVHEYTQLADRLPKRNAIVALNPDVHESLSEDFVGVRSVCSRVPGLMTSLHTSSVDLIMQYVGEPTHGTPAKNLISSCMLQQLRLHNTYSAHPALSATPGIILFGMITARHGTTTDNVTKLCTALNMAGFPNTFKVVIVGKPQEKALVKNLTGLTPTTPRLLYHGQLDSFNDLVGCRYAISFDPAGFRNNASAMVNVTRAGHLLFSRASGESNDQLIARAVKTIRLCELNPDFYSEMLTAQQPRFRSTSSLRVGHDLDLFFREVAAVADEAAK